MNKYEGHTPGPWLFDQGYGHANSRIVGSESVHVNGFLRNARGISSASYSETVCEITSDIKLPAPKANAKLIADAPMLAEQNAKMLAMLKCFTKDMKGISLVTGRRAFESPKDVARRTTHDFLEMAVGLIAEIDGGMF